jgi:imidazole glycerol phosphate synthase subunit HisF
VSATDRCCATVNSEQRFDRLRSECGRRAVEAAVTVSGQQCKAKQSTAKHSKAQQSKSEAQQSTAEHSKAKAKQKQKQKHSKYRIASLPLPCSSGRCAQWCGDTHSIQMLLRQAVEALGAGEVMLNSIDADGRV